MGKEGEKEELSSINEKKEDFFIAVLIIKTFFFFPNLVRKAVQQTG